MRRHGWPALCKTGVEYTLTGRKDQGMSMNYFDEEDVPERKPDTTIYPFLSLFLLLLAVFIFLNLFTTFKETKTEAVLDALAEVFGAEQPENLATDVLISVMGDTPAPQEVIEALENMWLTEVSVTNVRIVEPGDAMVHELPVTQVFVREEAVLRGDRIDLIAATAATISARIPDSVTRVKVLLFVEDLREALPDPDAPAGGDGTELDEEPIDLDDPDALYRIRRGTRRDGLDLALARADALARAMIDDGAPPDNVLVGVRVGDPSRIRFHYTIDMADAARMVFADEVPVAADAATPAPAQ